MVLLFSVFSKFNISTCRESIEKMRVGVANIGGHPAELIKSRIEK